MKQIVSLTSGTNILEINSFGNKFSVDVFQNKDGILVPKFQKTVLTLEEATTEFDTQIEELGVFNANTEVQSK